MIATIRFRKQTLVKEAELWDLSTVTAADYTCEVQLPKRVCKEIATGQSATFKKSAAYSYGIREYIDYSGHILKEKFKSIIEQHLAKLDGGSTPNPNLKVFDITFSYQNTKVFELLAKRGHLVKEENNEEINLVNREIEKYLDH